jgi:hypothetical protein
MITGAHAIIYSKNADADRDFLRDVLRFTHVDVGGGWLIFGLPPAEVAVHPSDSESVHELYLMTDDVEAFIAEMAGHGLACSPVTSQGWGMLTELTLPGGGKLGVYQPRHASPPAMGTPMAKARATAKKAVAGARATAKKAVAGAKVQAKKAAAGAKATAKKAVAGAKKQAAKAKKKR